MIRSRNGLDFDAVEAASMGTRETQITRRKIRRQNSGEYLDDQHVQRKAHEDLGRVVGQDLLNPVMRRPATTFKRAASRFFVSQSRPHLRGESRTSNDKC
jgi:hypothetical protein